MKNTYTKTETRISCPFPQVNGLHGETDKFSAKDRLMRMSGAYSTGV
jgi:hypothetical protein